MDDSAEYTPEGVVSELVPTSLTPDAVILGKQPEADIVWSADVIVDRSANHPDLVTVTDYCTVSDTQYGYSDMSLEVSAAEFVSNLLDVDPEDLVIVSFRWSLLTF